MADIITVKKFGGLNQALQMSEEIAYSPDMLNFKITDNFALRKRGGIRSIFDGSGDKIEGLWAGYIDKIYTLLFICDGNLYKLNPVTGTETVLGYVDTGPAVIFEFSGKVYILNGKKYSRYDGDTLSEVEGYVPLIAVGCSPSGAGTTYEDINLLTPKRRQQFSSDGISADYKLAEKNITGIHYIKLSGLNYYDYTYNLTAGTIHFNTVPPEGINNLEICYQKSQDRNRIIKNRFCMLFGGNVDSRLFLWGHPDYPNYRFHSELADGKPSVEYFPENNFTVIGNTEITDIVSQYDRQLIFTKDRAFYSYCEIRQDKLGNYYSSFPVYNLNGEKGNLIKGSCCIINNDPITFCNDGINRWSSTTVENEKNAVCISYPIADIVSEIIKGNSFSSLRLFDFQTNSELIFYYNQHAYIYNYKLGVWYVYDEMLCDFFCEYNGRLYFSYNDKIYFLSENETNDGSSAVTAYWKSPFFTAGTAPLRKDILELSVTVGTKNSTMLDMAVNSNLNKNSPFIESFLITNTTGQKLSCLRVRPNVKRVAKAQIYLRATGLDTDAEIYEISLISKTKGRYANGL